MIEFTMGNVKRIYVEKKAPFAVKARELKEEISSYLGITGVKDVRVFIRYDVENISGETFERAVNSVFSEPPVDILYRRALKFRRTGACLAWSFFRASLTSVRILLCSA